MARQEGQTSPQMQEREESEFEIRDGWASIGDGVDRIADRHWKFSVVGGQPPEFWG